MAQVNRYYWHGLLKFRCPDPCSRTHQDEQGVVDCFRQCGRHPKPSRKPTGKYDAAGKPIMELVNPEGWDPPEVGAFDDDDPVPPAPAEEPAVVDTAAGDDDPEPIA